MSDELLGSVVPINGGWRVKTTDWCHVDVLVMFGGNHRLVETYLDSPGEYNRGWCYTGSRALTVAVLAALAWDGRPETEPDGWVKEVSSNRCRRNGDPAAETIGWQP